MSVLYLLLAPDPKQPKVNKKQFPLSQKKTRGFQHSLEVSNNATKSVVTDMKIPKRLEGHSFPSFPKAQKVTCTLENERLQTQNDGLVKALRIVLPLL